MAQDGITITDQAVIDWIRAKVRDGEFASEAEALSSVVRVLREDEQDQQKWINTYGRAAYESYRANSGEVYTFDEIQQYLAERRKQRATQAA